MEVGQVLCIVEAMKLMNEIESDVAGELVKNSLSMASPLSMGRSCLPSGRRSKELGKLKARVSAPFCGKCG